MAAHDNISKQQFATTTVESEESFRAREEAFKRPQPTISDEDAKKANSLLDMM